MGRYWSIYKHQEVNNFGDGFKGLSNSGNRPDGAIRFDLEDDKITGYKASWNETGAGGKGWNLSKMEWFGKFTYSANGQLTNLALDRITDKSYGYYKPTNSDMQQAYSMAYSPRFSYTPGSIDNVYKYASYIDAIYREDGNHEMDIEYWGLITDAPVQDLYDPNTRHILVSNEEGFKSGFEDGWWNDVALKLNPEATAFFPESVTQYLKSNIVVASTWSDTVRINLEKTGSTSDSVIQAKQVDKSEYDSGFVGSIVTGTADDDIIRGLAGFDQLFGKAGDDLIHGGNGRDIIDGGSGSDELHGDFGWNTFLDQQDGSKDLIAIKSDQHLSNFWYGKAGNSPNGEKADFIEGLDATDEIKIIGVFTPDISVVDNVTARGVTGIGIYAKGTLEAVYTGGDLSTSQIQNMTTGDGSTTAMNNQMWSYWGDNTVPPLQT